MWSLHVLYIAYIIFFYIYYMNIYTGNITIYICILIIFPLLFLILRFTNLYNPYCSETNCIHFHTKSLGKNVVEKLYSVLKIFKFSYFWPSVTSWWLLVHETGGNFKYIFWTTSRETREVAKLGQSIDVSNANNLEDCN